MRRMEAHFMPSKLPSLGNSFNRDIQHLQAALSGHVEPICHEVADEPLGGGNEVDRNTYRDCTQGPMEDETLEKVTLQLSCTDR